MVKENTTTDPQGELLIQVNKKNKIIGSIPRGKAHKTPGIFYRTIFVLVMNDKKETLIHKRSSTKDLYPGCWDLSVGGHVNYGDSYVETAAREAGEELWLKVSEEDLILKGEVLVNLNHSGEFFNVFEYHLKPGESVSASREEIEETRWMSIKDIKRSMNDKSLKWYERPLQIIAALY